MNQAKNALIRGLGVLFFGAFFYFAWHAIWNRNEWNDWIAYALPAANWVLHGKLALPQLGSQHLFDQTWRFSSPLMGLAPIAPFLALGVGRESYLWGLFFFAALNFLLYAFAFKRVFAANLAAAALLAFLPLGNRAYFASLYNQRYDVAVFIAMLAAFFPGERPRNWQWAVAGALPLLHPSLAAVSGIWLLWPVLALKGGVFRERAGIALFVGSALLTWIWFGDLPVLKTQMLSYAHSYTDAMRARGERFPGIWMFSPVFRLGIPSELFLLASAVSPILLFWRGFRKANPHDLSVACVLIMGVLLDALWGFRYYPFLAIGLAPYWLSWFVRAGGKPVLVSLLLLSGLQLGVSAKLDRHPTSKMDERSAEAWIVAHSKPFDRIVVAPPFVLASAIDLPEGRKIVRVVPQPFCLDSFRVDSYREELRREANLFLGDPEWYERYSVTCRGAVPKQGELFSSPVVEKGELFGAPVIAVRKN